MYENSFCYVKVFFSYYFVKVLFFVNLFCPNIYSNNFCFVNVFFGGSFLTLYI